MIRLAPVLACVFAYALGAARPAEAVSVHAGSDLAVGSVLDELGAPPLTVDTSADPDVASTVPTTLSLASDAPLDEMATPTEDGATESDAATAPGAGASLQPSLESITKRIGGSLVDWNWDSIYKAFMPPGARAFASRELAAELRRSASMADDPAAAPEQLGDGVLRPETLLPALAALIVTVGLLSLAVWLRRVID